jgi:hypothetical protein
MEGAEGGVVARGVMEGAGVAGAEGSTVFGVASSVGTAGGEAVTLGELGEGLIGVYRLRLGWRVVAASAAERDEEEREGEYKHQDGTAHQVLPLLLP